MTNGILAPVPHRHWTFSIPRVLRGLVERERKLLGLLSQTAYASILKSFQAEMFGEFGVANYFNYAELAGIIAPRPFMVERGHNDGAGRDEMVAHEYAKVRRLYALLGIPERTAIEFFPGGHEIHGKGTFEFLHRHLKWPSP